MPQLELGGSDHAEFVICDHTIDAPDIRYETLNSEEGEHGGSEDGMEHTQGEYDLDMFRQAVVEGKHPDEEALSTDMPRWAMSDEDLAALFEYLKTLP